MRFLGQIIVVIVLLGILAIRWVNSDAWAQPFFRVMWWGVLLLVIVECLTSIGPTMLVLDALMRLVGTRGNPKTNVRLRPNADVGQRISNPNTNLQRAISAQV